MKTGFLVVEKLRRARIILKVGRISAKNDILTVQEKKQSHIGNKTKRILEMTMWQRELEAWQLKSSKMRMKKRIEK